MYHCIPTPASPHTSWLEKDDVELKHNIFRQIVRHLTQSPLEAKLANTGRPHSLARACHGRKRTDRREQNCISEP
jgi:hypothetical protein